MVQHRGEETVVGRKLGPDENRGPGQVETHFVGDGFGSDRVVASD
jgi:hypothetical protein